MTPTIVRRARAALIGVVAATALACTCLTSGAPAVASGAAAFVRTDQVGYLPADTKIAYLMSPDRVAGEHWHVVDASGRTVLGGRTPAKPRGSWNRTYRDVYAIDLSRLTRTGTYRVVVAGSESATSHPFRIENARALYGPIVSDGVQFFQAQRDGQDIVPGPLHRRPAHPADAHATVYGTPDFIPDSNDGTGDQIRGPLVPLAAAAPVDVSGGWFDAGDYLKFTFTASYADALLSESALALGRRAPAALVAEARFGTRWLDRMWNPTTRTLYLQVGIGEGDGSTYLGDHDLWRLPQDDAADAAPEDRYAARDRPVFEAAAPGRPIAPDLVGRVSAAFALAAQVDARRGDASAARAQLARAVSLYRMADLAPKGTLETVLPAAYYPDSSWHDDMELGAAEIARAMQALGAHASSTSSYIRQAAQWAGRSIADDDADTLNLYDVSAIAHGDLIAAIRSAPRTTGLAVSPKELAVDLKRQLAGAERASAAQIFRQGGDETDFDVDSHTFGFIATEAIYRRATGDAGYRAFAGEQRDWLLGGNPWGTSFMTGVGAVSPRCLASQIPNLAAPAGRSQPQEIGAVVNGPNGADQFDGGLGDTLPGMVACENDTYEAFTGHGSEYVDDVRSWQASEPALDMTGGAVLAAALQQSTSGHR